MSDTHAASPLSRRTALQAGALTVSTALAANYGLGQRSALTAENGARATKPRIKLGQIGVGHAHAGKLGVYRTGEDYEIVGIVEPDEALRAKVQQQPTYRDLPWMTQEQLLNVPGLQAVLVETHVRDSLNAAEACLAAGKHVHLDKPAGESLAHYERLLKLAAQKQLLMQMGYMFRYSPAVLLLKEVLQAGWLGELTELHTTMSKVVPAAQRRALAEYPGGIMFELGCHVIDLVVMILGKPDKVTPYARQVVREDKLLDNMLAVFEYPRATATVRSSAVEVDGATRRHLTVCGTGGTFHIQPLDRPAAKITLAKGNERFKAGTHDIPFTPYTRYIGDAIDMAKIIRGEKASDYSYEHDQIVQRCVLEASAVQPDTAG